MIIKDTFPQLIETLTVATGSAEKAIQLIQSVVDHHINSSDLSIDKMKDDWNLSNSFVWINTPQGHAFWWTLHKKMSEYYKLMDLLSRKSL